MYPAYPECKCTIVEISADEDGLVKNWGVIQGIFEENEIYTKIINKLNWAI